jgi:hypothetical protein
MEEIRNLSAELLSSEGGMFDFSSAQDVVEGLLSFEVARVQKQTRLHDALEAAQSQEMTMTYTAMDLSQQAVAQLSIAEQIQTIQTKVQQEVQGFQGRVTIAVEPIQQVWNGSAEFGRTVTATLNRNGDLITNMYSVVMLRDVVCENGVKWGYVRRLGYALIDETKVEIGGSKIDEQYGDWLNIWYELTHKIGQEAGHAKMIGDTADFNAFKADHDQAYLYIPLIYWFNRFNGLALPLIALQYHDVRLNFELENLEKLYVYTKGCGPRTAPTFNTKRRTKGRVDCGRSACRQRRSRL